MGIAETFQTSKTGTRPKTWIEFIGTERYACAIYRLQEEAGLTFKEARALLTPEQDDKDLAEMWGCSLENIYNLARRGREKVKKITGDDHEKYREYVPQYMSYVP